MPAFLRILMSKRQSHHAPASLCAGHRSTRPASLSLKRGMLHYAHSRQLPIQVGGSGGAADWVVRDRGSHWEVHPPCPLVLDPGHLTEWGKQCVPSAKPPPHSVLSCWVQVITTRGKESVLSEKRMRAGYGATLVTGFSDVIESKDLPDFEGFAAEVSMLGH